MKKAITPQAAAEMIPDGAVLMIGGFMGVGSPYRVIEALAQLGRKNLTVIGNDAARPGIGIGRLISAGLVSRVIASHIGLNPELGKAMVEGRIEVELVPQGTLAERVRAAGFGLGGVLTKTGLGTPVEETSQVLEINGEKFIYAPPLPADFALINAHYADYLGNLTYQLTATNFNPLMAMAGKTVIAEPREIVPVGVLPPDAIKTPGCLVDELVVHA